MNADARRSLLLRALAAAVLGTAVAALAFAYGTRSFVSPGLATPAPLSVREAGPYLVTVTGADAATLRTRLAAALGAERAAAIDLEHAGIADCPLATTLALESLAPRELEALRAALDDLAVRLEARMHPLGMDLFDGEPDDELRATFERFLPALNASRALVSERWVSPDRSLVVVPTLACPSALPEGVECRAAWSEDTPTRAQRRLRFVAWPVAAAALLRWPTEGEAGRASEALRAVAAGEGRLGLVVTRESADARRGRLRAVRAAAGQAARLVARADGRRVAAELALLRQVEHEPAAAPLPAWLRLGATDVLIVPRLSALAHLGDFVATIDAALVAAGLGAGAIWVHRPSPL